jgi:hypothetical protein
MMMWKNLIALQEYTRIHQNPNEKGTELPISLNLSIKWGYTIYNFSSHAKADIPGWNKYLRGAIPTNNTKI